jgi:Rrf2 family cysteine metabolism transcriptional repressor
MALKYMDQKPADNLTSTKELCDQQQVSFEVLAKVMQAMNSAGILESGQGAHGGYRIAKCLDEVSLHELNEAVLGPLQFAYCLHSDSVRCLLTGSCNVISPVVSLSRRIEALFRELSVEELLGVDDPVAQEIRNKHQHDRANGAAADLVWK